MDPSNNEAIIRKIVESLETAWNSGDGEAFGEAFAEDADYTVWNGIYVKGKEEIVSSHQRLFNTVFKGTVQRLEVEKIRFLRDDIAVVHGLGGTIDTEPEKWPKVRPLFVLSKQDEKWQLDVFHNTPVVHDHGNRPLNT